MKWNSPKPKLGDVRSLEKFAWLPVKTDNGYTVWLETYSVRQQYREMRCGNPDWCPIWSGCLTPSK